MNGSPKPLVAIACGGTGGHLFPGLAVGEELLKLGCRVQLLISPKEVDQQAVRYALGMETVVLPAIGLTRGKMLRFAKGFLDLLTVYFLTGFRNRPQHLLGTAGLLLFVAGFGCMCLLAVGWCLTRIISSWEPLHLHERALFYFAILGMLLGVQLLSIGFIAELVIALNRTELPYSIKESTSSI